MTTGPSLEHLQTLNEIAQTLNQAVDMEGALRATLPRLIALLGLETGWVFLRDPAETDRWQGRGYRLAAHHNLPPALDLASPAAWDGGCDCQGFCNKGKLTEAYNEVACTRLADSSGDRRGLNVHASAPLRAGTETLGILNVAAPAWDAFTPDTLALLTNIGHHLGVALARARLFDQLRAQRIDEQAALLALSQALLGQTDLPALVGRIVAEVHRLSDCDACALLLPDDAGAHLTFVAAAGWHSDPAAAGRRLPLNEEEGYGQALRRQEPLLLDKAAWSSLPWEGTEGFQHALVVPLVTAETAVGLLLVHSRRPGAMTPDARRFFRLMANQAALAIRTSQLRAQELAQQRLEQELAMSRRIQLSMLPPTCPQVEGYRAASFYEAARQVGGDFYNLLPLSGRPARASLYIADVSDKGVPAALFMAQSRSVLHHLALDAPQADLASLLAELNRRLRRDNNADMFLSLFFATLELGQGALTYVNAGHNPPLWWQAATGTIVPLTGRGMVLGILDRVDLAAQQVALAPGDVLLLYTDGVTEAMDGNGAFFGPDRLTTELANCAGADPERIVAAVAAAVKAFADGAPPADDVTMLAIKRDP